MDRLLRVIRRARARHCQHGCGYKTRKPGILAIHYAYDHAGDPVVIKESA